MEDLNEIVQEQVDKAVASSSSKLLADLDALITTRITNLQSEITQNQSIISSNQLEAINSIKSVQQPSFKRKGNQQQFQFNGKVQSTLEEAKSSLESPLTEQSILSARDSMSKGMELISHRQKLIRLADQSEAGWAMVTEYETNELADNSDDEKRIAKADAKAVRKFKDSRVKKSRKQIRVETNSRIAYPTPVSGTRQGQQGTSSQLAMGQRRGLCFSCGRPGHYRRECVAVSTAHNKISTINSLSKLISSSIKPTIGNALTSIYFGEGVLSPLANKTCPIDQYDRDEVRTGELILDNNDSPIGKLRNAFSTWKEAGSNSFILEIVKFGYKLPLFDTPPISFCKNNLSALENAEFVSLEIEKLFEKGCISVVQEIPKVVNPLTVACNKPGKRRLVLDCRVINLFLFKFGIKLDGIEIAEQLFQKGDYLFTFDLKSAYHHIEIFNDHRDYLGFAWKRDNDILYYVFNVLPFGLSTAAYIFTKLVRVMVSYWREQSFRIAMYMDDGCGGASNMNDALTLSKIVQSNISKFGFLIAHDKCEWLPSNTVTWLGHVIDTNEGCISVTECRILSLLEDINDVTRLILAGIVSINVRKLARIAGKIISMHTAVGPLVQFKSRYLYNCIESRSSWRGRVAVNSNVLNELLFWQENVSRLNGRIMWRDDRFITDRRDTSLMGQSDMFPFGKEGKIATSQVDTVAMGLDGKFAMDQGGKFAMARDGKFAMGQFDKFAMGQCGKSTINSDDKFAMGQTDKFAIGQYGKSSLVLDKRALTAYSDASDIGYGGYVVEEKTSDVSGWWAFDEHTKSSTWRELEAVSRVMSANKSCLSGHSVKWYTDSQNVVRILKVGSKMVHLHDIAVRIYDNCREIGMEIYTEWIPRELNDRADSLSRGGDCDDWGISKNTFSFLDSVFGPHTVDRFASDHNAKLLRYNSRWAYELSEGIDAFAHSWVGENNWLVPPPRLVVPTLRKLKTEAACGLGLDAKVKAAVHTDNAELLRLSQQLPSIIVGSRSDNTNKKYWTYFKKWESFVRDKGLPISLPGNPVHVALFLTSLIDNGSSFSTISASFYAIKWAHSLSAEKDPTLHPFVISVLECAKRRCSKPIVKKDPVNSKHLHDLCFKYVDSNDLLIVRDITMILLCFCGFFRYNEIQNLKCNDVHILDDHLKIVITKSKTDQYREGNNVLISRLDSVACPYNMFLRYINIASIDMSSTNFLFRPIIRSKNSCFLSTKLKGLSYSRAREVILERLREVDGSANFGIHSLRSGGASAAANCAAVNERCWKRHGRWRSESAKDGYVKDSIAKRLKVSQNLGL